MPIGAFRAVFSERLFGYSRTVARTGTTGTTERRKPRLKRETRMAAETARTAADKRRNPTPRQASPQALSSSSQRRFLLWNEPPQGQKCLDFTDSNPGRPQD